MNKSFEVCCKVYMSDENDECVPAKGNYCLLEPVTGQDWYHDKNKGLAEYLRDDLNKFVSSITYHYKNGMIYFCVNFYPGSICTSMVEYRGKTITLKEAVCEYLKGQISDGWGENGGILYDWLADKCFHVWYDYDTLYEKDYDKSKELAMNDGKNFYFYDDFDKYPAFKEVEF